MAKSTTGSESSAPRPAPVQPRPEPRPGIVHHGSLSRAGTASKSGWGGKK